MHPSATPDGDAHRGQRHRQQFPRFVAAPRHAAAALPLRLRDITNTKHLPNDTQAVSLVLNPPPNIHAIYNNSNRYYTY